MFGFCKPLKFINPVFNILRPLGSRLALIKSLPRNRFADGDAEMLAHIPVHLVNQKQHGEIERQILVAKSGDAVETFRVAPSEMDRHHIALIFYTLRDKRLLQGRSWMVPSLRLRLFKPAGNISMWLSLLKPASTIRGKSRLWRPVLLMPILTGFKPAS